MAFERVFEPIEIGNVKIANRVFRCAHGSQFDGERLGARLIAYHAERARAGVGLSILEAGSVHHSSVGQSLSVRSDDVIRDYEALVASVRPFGMKLFQQLWHGGAQAFTADGSPPWAPSTQIGYFASRQPRPMSIDMIEELVAAYAAAARRCEAGGLDGCEVQFNHGYLIGQFLSPLFNHRTDEYGGSFENRLRFGRKVLEAVRHAVSIPVGIRISEDNSPGGLTAADCAEIANALERLELVDFVNASQSNYLAPWISVPGMDKPEGVMLPAVTTMVAGLRRVPRLITSGRLRTLEDAEQILRSGVADMTSMVRAMIADPALIAKSRDNRVDEVRPCIACNQGCVAGAVTGQGMGCTVNPSVGQEATLSESLIERSSTPRRVVVVGGGPAGMEAARVAALSGHQVILMEAMPGLGGLVNVARRAPALYTIGDFVSWQEREIYRLGVDVRLSTFADTDDILAERPDCLIIATGSYPRLDGVQAARPGVVPDGVGLGHVISSVDLLTEQRDELGATALVFDDVGHYEAIAAAEYLVERGLKVTYATRFSSFAPAIEWTLRLDPALQRLQKNPDQFTIITRSFLSFIRPGEADIAPLNSDWIRTVPADTVVLVSDRIPMRDLHDTMAEKVRHCAVVGDAQSPSDLQTAVREGHLAARAIATLAWG